MSIAEWLTGTGIVDAVIAITVLELAILLAHHRRTGRGLAPSELLPDLGAGLFLMLGIRAVLAGAAWPWLPVCLAGAGLSHLVHLIRRWPRP